VTAISTPSTARWLAIQARRPRMMTRGAAGRRGGRR
jgi:hypothetical protein